MDNPECEKEFIYWFCAHFFKFTPDQVDKLPYDRMVYMINLEQEMTKLEKDSLK